MATITWKLDADGLWPDPLNWSAGRLPGTADVALLTSPSARTITHDSGSHAVLGITATDDLIAVSGGTLVSSGAVTLGAGLRLGGGRFIAGGGTIGGPLTMDGGTLAVTSGTVLRLSGPADMAAGTWQGPGTIVTAGSAAIAQGTTLTLGYGLAWTNTGTVILTGKLGTVSNNVVALRNVTGAVWELAGDGVAIDTLTGAGSTFSNAGTFGKVSGTGASVIESVLVNSGTLLIATGTLEIDGGGTLGGTIDGAGALALASPVQLSALTQTASGTVAVLASIRVAGTATLSGTCVQIGRTATIAAGATLGLAGTATLGGHAEVDGPGSLATSGYAVLGAVMLGGGVAWTNRGAVTAYGTIATTGAVRIAIVNSGLLELRNDFASIRASGTSSTLVNTGTLAKRSGTGTSTVNSYLTSTGAIVVASGTLELTGGGTISGSLSGGGTLSFGAGNFWPTLAAICLPVVVKGASCVTASASTFSRAITVFGTLDLTAGSLLLSGGLTISAGRVSVTGHATVTGGLAMDGDGVLSLDLGTVVTIADPVRLAESFVIEGGGTIATAGPVSAAAGGYSCYLGGGLSWANAGSIDIGGALCTIGGQAVTIDNAAGASFRLAGDRACIADTSAASVFDNEGWISRDGDDGFSWIDSSLRNNGVVNAARGTLDLTKPVEGNGTLRIGAGATLEAAAIGISQTVAFGGDAATLMLDFAQDIVMPMAGFGAGCAIDLTTIAGATATINGNTLLVNPGAGNALRFVSSTSLAGESVTVPDDGIGGSLIVIGDAARASPELRGETRHLLGGAVRVAAELGREPVWHATSWHDRA